MSNAGAFKHLISNNTFSFTGKVLIQFCELIDMKKIHISSYPTASNARYERFHGTLCNSLETAVTQDKDWVQMLPFIELAFPRSSVRGLGISPYEIRHSGYSMALPIDTIMLKKFDEKHLSSPEYIVKIRNNIDRLNYIILQNKKENHLVIKKTYDRKVTPFRFYKGQRCYL